MHLMMPRATIKCSKCDSTDIVYPEMVSPEWPANSPVPRPAASSRDGVQLRCKGCGHEKKHDGRTWLDGSTLPAMGTLTIKQPKEETF